MMALGTLNMRVRPLIERLDQMSLRERGLIFAVGVVLIYCLWQVLLMDPLVARARAAEQRLNGAREKILAVDQAGAAIVQDPAVGAAVRNKVLQRRLGELDQELERMAQGYVSPGKMTAMLREVLANQHGLRLISLKNLPTKSLSDAAAATPATASNAAAAGDTSAGAAALAMPAVDAKDRGPFLHPVEIVVEGDYASIVAYLHSLEALPYEMHWDRVELDVHDYPNNRVRIVIGPLSLSRQWITV